MTSSSARPQNRSRNVAEQQRLLSFTNVNSTHMLCCCCWPLYSCALTLSIIDTSFVGIFTFRSAELVFKSTRNSKWIDISILLFFLASFTCELLSLLTLGLSHSRNNSRYVIPRITLLTGQAALTTFISLFLVLYFVGFSQYLNDIFISSYEYWMDEKLSANDRADAVHELFVYAVGIFILSFIYTIYELFELYITKKYQNTLDTPPEFIPVLHQEPPRPAGPNLNMDQTHYLPPPPYNPQYC
ncbi:unnamed protein product [Thelazia callipaeda]|uniref:MARVEL domain-containing protein n=1 Tax=Thelazia callipaeda TaxID=103827 RepID=A0A0N5CQ18_THECL|nr:unnamed protein product [Thelazia callipaeda]